MTQLFIRMGLVFFFIYIYIRFQLLEMKFILNSVVDGMQCILQTAEFHFYLLGYSSIHFIQSTTVAIDNWR